MQFQYTTKNEPVREYKPNSKEKQSLLDEYHRMANQIIEIPIIIIKGKIIVNKFGTR